MKVNSDRDRGPALLLWEKIRAEMDGLDQIIMQPALVEQGKGRLKHGGSPTFGATAGTSAR
jgi:hypothetical protein